MTRVMHPRLLLAEAAAEPDVAHRCEDPRPPGLSESRRPPSVVDVDLDL